MILLLFVIHDYTDIRHILFLVLFPIILLLPQWPVFTEIEMKIWFMGVYWIRSRCRNQIINTERKKEDKLQFNMMSDEPDECKMALSPNKWTFIKTRWKCTMTNEQEAIKERNFQRECKIDVKMNYVRMPLKRSICTHTHTNTSHSTVHNIHCILSILIHSLRRKYV